MPATLTANRRKQKPMNGWHALLWFIGFFGFMFVVNGIFLWKAIASFPGEDVQKSYLTGLDYNTELARRAYQSEQGWTAEIGLAQETGPAELHVRILNSDGSALPVFATRALMRHPTDTALDTYLNLTPLGGGEYGAPLSAISSGIWSVVITADIDPDKDGHEFHAAREIRVP